MSRTDDFLDTCNCCPDEPEQPQHYNPPGQNSLRYRIGTHGAFLARMIANLTRSILPDGEHAGQKPLADLTTREPDDPAIAMLDVWAVAADILTFYQERIANEGFLRTATERRSVLELARAIGYELGPGVAATTYLAFALEEADGAPDTVLIPKGTAVQSIPAQQGETPQTFETSEDFTGYPAWNTLRPQLTKTQAIADIETVPQVYIQGTNNNVQQGDMLLLVDNSGGTVSTAARRITDTTTDFDHDYTIAALETLSSSGSGASVSSGGSSGSGTSGGSVSFSGQVAFTGANVDSLVYNMTLSEAGLQAKLGMYNWAAGELLSYSPAPPPPGVSLHVFREVASCFGHNAPRWETLPKPSDTRGGKNSDPYKNGWDGSSARTIWQDSQGAAYTAADIYLERAVKGVNNDSWVVLVSQATDERPAYQVQKALEASRVDFGLSGKTTALDISRADGGSPAEPTVFKVRETTVYLKSEELTLAALPVTTTVAKDSTSITLDGLVLGLAKNQPVALSGEQVDAEGVTRREVHFLKDITHSGGRTTLTFTTALAYGYKRDTLKLTANVVEATHGETVAQEILGSGQGSQTNQRFTLKKPPLTYTSSTTASGTESSLELRVDGVQWDEASSLYPLASDDKEFIVRRDNDGNSTVIFGDGKHGARLPTGQENVTARYRSGIGTTGEVAAQSLTLLKSKPLGVKTVENPLAPSGAGDPETLDDARDNAPLTVRTLERIVSLQDFTDFARAFAGISKALTIPLWSGEQQIVHITIATDSGGAVQEPLLGNLRTAINNARDPWQRVELGSFQPRYFHVKASLLVDPALVWDDVEAAVRDAIETAFAFSQRAFAQPVTAAEMVHLIHSEEGVIAVDLDELHLVDDNGDPVGDLLSSVLTAQTARWNSTATAILPAELLMVNPPGITLSKMKTE